MKGCPNGVDQFIFDYNNLTSLEFSTEIVNDRFSCTYNKLTSLEFGPKKVKGDYSVGYNGSYSSFYFFKRYDIKLSYLAYILNNQNNKLFIENLVILYKIF